MSGRLRGRARLRLATTALAATVAAAAGAAAGSGCASTRSPTAARAGDGTGDPLSQPDPEISAAAGTAALLDAIYARLGLVASGPPLSYVVNVGTFATSVPDTSVVVVAISLPNRGLTFRHDSGGYRAVYDVGILLQRDGAPDLAAHDRDTVRIAGFRETTRADESIIYRRVLPTPPGTYRATFTIRDVESGRTAGKSATLSVRRFTPGTITRPVLVYFATPRTRLDLAPEYLARPRASATFGVDDSVLVYIEQYDAQPTSLVGMSLRDSVGQMLWNGTVRLPLRAPGGDRSPPLASGIVSIPLSRATMGVLLISATLSGRPDTVGTALYLGFGAGVPAMSFDQMLGYLRFFATPERIMSLRTAPPEERGARWTAFLRETDPRPQTPQNEALEAYFARIRVANEAFRSDMPRGWRSDRGSVYVALGEPTRASEGYAAPYEVGDFRAALGSRFGNRVHVLVWDYDPLQARIVFYDPGDTGSWHFAPSGAQTFRILLGRVLSR